MSSIEAKLNQVDECLANKKKLTPKAEARRNGDCKLLIRGAQMAIPRNSSWSGGKSALAMRHDAASYHE